MFFWPANNRADDCVTIAVQRNSRSRNNLDRVFESIFSSPRRAFRDYAVRRGHKKIAAGSLF
jgi:hypothetical protein